MKAFPYTRCRRELFQLISRHDLERLARSVWWGQYPRCTDQKFAELPALGIKPRQAYFFGAGGKPFAAFQWVQVGEFDIYLEPRAQGAFQGRLHVRRHQVT